VGAFTETFLPNRQTTGFSACLDSKGRITVPSQVRDRYSLEAGDRVSLCVSSPQALVREVGGRREAIKVVESLGSVKSFSYRSGILEVILDE
jgi:AbrB family looped-hinge helix DNA binding protein